MGVMTVGVLDEMKVGKMVLEKRAALTAESEVELRVVKSVD